MIKSLYLFSIPILIPTLIFAEMACGTGKCGASMEKETPKIEQKAPEKAIPKATAKIDNKRPTIKQLFNVNTVQVKEIKSTQRQTNYGYIVAKDSFKVDVVAWYGGFVEKLYADTLYKYVKKGEALVKVYSPEVYKAKQDYLNSLNFSGSHTSKGMLKSAKTKLALLGVATKEIRQIENTRKIDEFSTIYAQSTGWIFEKYINQGSSFASKKKLFQIVNLKKVWLEVQIFQNQFKDIAFFNTFSVSVKGIDKSYTAKKSLVYPMLNPKEATMTLRLEIDNKKGLLKTGMYAKVERSAKTKKALVIPRTSAIRKGGLWYAFLATEFKGEYEPIEIKVKSLDKDYYEVTKGLTTKDIIVNNALFMMDSDAQINAIY